MYGIITNTGIKLKQSVRHNYKHGVKLKHSVWHNYKHRNQT